MDLRNNGVWRACIGWPAGLRICFIEYLIRRTKLSFVMTYDTTSKLEKKAQTKSTKCMPRSFQHAGPSTLPSALSSFPPFLGSKVIYVAK